MVGGVYPEDLPRRASSPAKIPDSFIWLSLDSSLKLRRTSCLPHTLRFEQPAESHHVPSLWLKFIQFAFREQAGLTQPSIPEAS